MMRPILVLLIGAFLTWVVTAAKADRPTIAAVGSVTYDDNLFRLPTKDRQVLPHSGTDLISTLGVSGQYSLALEPFSLSLSGQANKVFYKHNPFLNAFAYIFSGEAAYSGGHGEITLDLSREARATNFEDLRFGFRNIQTFNNAHLSSKILVAGALNVLTDVTASSNLNSSDIARAADNRQLETIVGLGYISPAANILALELRYATQHSLSQHAVLLNNDLLIFRPDSVEKSAGIRVEWHSSEIWSVTARGGYTWHDNKNGILRNARGPTGAATIIWAPTRLIKVTAKASRSFSAPDTLFANGVDLTSYGLGIGTQPFKDTRLTLGYDRRIRKFSYDTQINAPFGANRTERLSSYSLKLDRTVTRGIHLSLEADHRTRGSDVAFYRYHENAFTFSLAVPILR